MNANTQSFEVEQMTNIDFSDTKTQEGLIALLRAMPIQVTFRKTNGEVRNMLCTRQKDWIEDWHPIKARREEDEDPFPEDRRKKYAHVCQVFDLKKRAWRSFRWTSVIGFSSVF